MRECFLADFLPPSKRLILWNLSVLRHLGQASLVTIWPCYRLEDRADLAPSTKSATAHSIDLGCAPFRRDCGTLSSASRCWCSWSATPSPLFACHACRLFWVMPPPRSFSCWASHRGWAQLEFTRPEGFSLVHRSYRSWWGVSCQHQG